MNRRTIALFAATLLVVSACASQDEFSSVREATEDFKDVPTARAAGYEEFLVCFDSDAGGMGQHYVDVADLDGEVDATHPESMLYEVGSDGTLTLTSVEYIVPNAEPPGGQTTAPELYGQTFQLVEDLNVWAMHAWVFKDNPDGMFADFNPDVGPCPAV